MPSPPPPKKCAMAEIARLSTRDADFDARLARLTAFDAAQDEGVDRTVAEILAQVKRRGDAAVLDYTARFDGVAAGSLAELELPHGQLARARDALPGAQREALEQAAARVRGYHERQLAQSGQYTEADGTVLGQKVTPITRVGLYVPGGKAAYPSSVLMNALPAKVAGVAEIVMVVPTPGGEVNLHVLAAAKIAGVDRVFRVGGAQALAALAYGTASIPRVDKITGPGNIYVATAKKQVFGRVDIDMIAGPSEILIINDGSGNPAHLAADLLSQAEHDELASSVLVTTDATIAAAVQAQVEVQLQLLSREAIARKSIETYGAIIIARDLAEAIDFSNRLAPEHLELAVNEPFAILPQIRHAGAIFMGHHTPEAAGDYLAGPNHTLPTGGTARFFSPLSVDDYVKKSSIVSFSATGLKRLGSEIVRIAELEGLEAHARC